MTVSSGELGFGFGASFKRALTGGLALCFCWAKTWPQQQIENVKMAATIHFEEGMSTDLSSLTDEAQR